MRRSQCLFGLSSPTIQKHRLIYLPISRRDRPLLLGIRDQLQLRIQSIVVRTKLISNVVVVGMRFTGAVWDRSLGISGPLTMIYEKTRFVPRRMLEK